MFDFIVAYTNALTPISPPKIIGSKETYCEEYVPYLLARRAKVLMVVRDPRDIVASLNHGSGRRFGGPLKPHLFNIRQWRKSVAFAVSYERTPGFLCVRYEDLVTNPLAELERITEFLDLEPLSEEVIIGDLFDQSGLIWDANSSQVTSTRITPRSVGSYKRVLSREIDLLFQATCFAEMRLLGYSLDLAPTDVLPTLERHRSNEALERDELAAYLWSHDRLAEERQRWLLLRRGDFEPTLFVLKPAFSVLTEFLRGFPRGV